MANQDDAYEAIIDNIANSAKGATPAQLVLLAESYAWVVSPSQAHGGNGSNGH